jgi:colicin import membrane protein
MAQALEQRPYVAHEEPGKTASAVLALGMHLLLAAVLFLGVSWQSRPPEAVTVELWTAPPAPPPAPAPKVEQPRPEPKPEVRPEPKPEPRPEPRVEKPDIAIEQEKRRLEEERKAREAEAERQRKLAEQKKLEEQKKLAEQKRQEEQKQLEERKKAEEQKRLAEDKRRLEAENRQRLNDQLARELKGTQSASAGIPGARITGPANVAGATSGDTDAYRAKIAAKIKGNVILPMDVIGNPIAEFEVIQAPTGDVLNVKRSKSSGNPTLDEAWERAIWKSTPLPKPDNPAAFERRLTLRFRPHD